MKSVAAIMLSFFFRWHYFTTSYFIIPLLGLPLVAQCLISIWVWAMQFN